MNSKFFFMLLLISFLVKAVSAQTELVSNGSLGEVKYSILEPTLFLKLNPGWVLMQGQKMPDSKLAKLYGIKDIPDARGLFIRGMNFGRGVGEGDADGDRLIASYQGDKLKRHDHYVGREGTSDPMPLGHSNSGNGSTWRISSDDGPSWNNASINLLAQKNQDGGEETRPRNIALYIYIKVD
ncbi:hypothetical protein [Dyadobacter bucti]|uniref:hypothetical protein n=1 Tax=Dyadobacter bucti TaxID=2572203 RepID=UPI001109FB0A|nr:hypothetical protein [Dyadobacter bucti]